MAFISVGEKGAVYSDGGNIVIAGETTFTSNNAGDYGGKSLKIIYTRLCHAARHRRCEFVAPPG